MAEAGIHEILTTEQFADRMGVCVKTVHNWKNSNRLINGRHYFAEKDTVRFPWPLACLRLMDDLLAEGMRGTKRCCVGKPLAPKPKQNNTIRSCATVKTARFNSDYGKEACDE